MAGSELDSKEKGTRQPEVGSAGTQPAEASGQSLVGEAWGSLSTFTGSFARSAAAPLTGLGELAGIHIAPTAQASDPKHAMAETAGNIAGTAFDYILLSTAIGRLLPRGSAIGTSTIASGTLGFASPTEDGSLRSHLNQAAVGASSGFVMSGLGAFRSPVSFSGRMFQTTLSGAAGGLTAATVDGVLGDKPFDTAHVGTSALTWAGTGLAMGLIHQGAISAFGRAGSAAPPGVNEPAAAETPPAIKDAAAVSAVEGQPLAPRAAGEPVAIREPVAVRQPEQLPRTDRPTETVADAAAALPAVSEARIAEIARSSGVYYFISAGRTDRQCLILSRDLQKALSQEGIPTLLVGTPENTRFDMPHFYLVAKTENGFRIVDPTLNQFAPEFRDLFIGTREQAIALAKSSTQPINPMWIEMSDNRSNWDKIWSERPLVQPIRYEPPSAADLAEFNARWQGSGVQLYDEQLAEQAARWAARTPNWDLSLANRFELPSMRRFVPDSFIARVSSLLPSLDTGEDFLTKGPLERQSALETRIRMSESNSDVRAAAETELSLLTGQGGRLEPRTSFRETPTDQLSAAYATMPGRSIDPYTRGSLYYDRPRPIARDTYPNEHLRDLSRLLQARYANRSNLNLLEIAPDTTTDVPRALGRNLQTYIALDAQHAPLTAQREFLSGSEIPSMHHVRGDMVRLPFADHSQDVVVVSNNNVFFSGKLQEMELAVREIWRVLRPDGELVVQPWRSVFWMDPNETATQLSRQDILLSRFQVADARARTDRGDRFVIAFTKRNYPLSD